MTQEGNLRGLLDRIRLTDWTPFSPYIGAWPSLVGRIVRDDEVASSNLAVPTDKVASLYTPMYRLGTATWDGNLSMICNNVFLGQGYCGAQATAEIRQLYTGELVGYVCHKHEAVFDPQIVYKL